MKIIDYLFFPQGWFNPLEPLYLIVDVIVNIYYWIMDFWVRRQLSKYADRYRPNYKDGNV